MTLREDLLIECSDHAIKAAAMLAHRLILGHPDTFKAGYSKDNAVLAAVELFPEVTGDQIRDQLESQQTDL